MLAYGLYYASMIHTLVLPDDRMEHPDARVFQLFADRVRPVLQAARERLEEMYEPVLGRPPIDPVLLMGIVVLQMLERLPDRQAVSVCWFDLRWRIALDLPADWKGIHPTTLCGFRARLVSGIGACLYMHTFE